MRKKVCKSCKYFYEGADCPICKSSGTAGSWQGRVYVLDTARSVVAKNIGITVKGEYAIKVR